MVDVISKIMIKVNFILMTQDPEEVLNIYLSLQGVIRKAFLTQLSSFDAEDALQEVYLRISKENVMRRMQSPKAYILQTAKNVAIDIGKSGHAKAMLYMDQDSLDALFLEKKHPANAVEDEYEEASSLRLADEAVRALPPRCRLVFVMKFVQGLSHKAIAEEMKISESAIEKHLASGISRCRAYVERASGSHNISKEKKLDKL